MNIKSCVDWQHVCRPIRRQRPPADAAKLCYSRGAGFQAGGFSTLSLPPSPRSLSQPSTRPRPSRANPWWRPNYEFRFFWPSLKPPACRLWCHFLECLIYILSIKIKTNWVENREIKSKKIYALWSDIQTSSHSHDFHSCLILMSFQWILKLNMNVSHSNCPSNLFHFSSGCHVQSSVRVSAPSTRPSRTTYMWVVHVVRNKLYGVIYLINVLVRSGFGNHGFYSVKFSIHCSV